MASTQVPFNFQLPKEVLERLRKKSKESGVPVSALIKIKISGDSEEKIKMEKSSEMSVAKET